MEYVPGGESFTVYAFAWSYHVRSVTPEGSTLTLLRLSPDDSGTYTCFAVSPAGRQTKIYTLFVLGQEGCFTKHPLWILCSLFTSDLLRHSSSIHLWWDLSAQRGPGDPGQCCEPAVPGGGEPSSSDELAEERTPAAPLSSYTSSLCWLCVEVSSDRVQQPNIQLPESL